jgi:integrase
LADFFDGRVRSVEPPSNLYLLRSQFVLWSSVSSSGSCCLEACLCPLPDDFPFKLRESSKIMKDQLTPRCRCVDVFGEQAVRWALVARNVADAATAPRPTKKEIRPLTPDQARTLLDAARGERFEALYVLAITAGLRRDELLGLRWQDVDLERGNLQVHQQLVRTKKEGLCFTSPKSGKSREVRLTQGAIDALKSHRKRQNEERG